MNDGEGVLDRLLAGLLCSQLQTQRSVPRALCGVSKDVVRLDQDPVHRRLLLILFMRRSFAAVRNWVEHFGLADVVEVCQRPCAAAYFNERVRHSAVGGSRQELVRLQRWSRRGIDLGPAFAF